jgi:hypothetical protein
MTHRRICKNVLSFFPTKPTVLLVPSTSSIVFPAAGVLRRSPAPDLLRRRAGHHASPAPAPRCSPTQLPRPFLSVHSPHLHPLPQHKYRLFIPRFGLLGDSAYSGGVAATNWSGADQGFASEQRRSIWRAWGWGRRWAAAVRRGGVDEASTFFLHGGRQRGSGSWRGCSATFLPSSSLFPISFRLLRSASPNPCCTPWLLFAPLWSACWFRITQASVDSESTRVAFEA